MSKDTPAPPDYVGAANATAQSSKDVTEQQTFANRPNINTPWSQQTWANTPTWDPTTGQYLNQWTQNTNLTPEAQKALDSQLAVQSGVSGTAQGLLQQNQQQLNAPVDWSNFQATGKAPTAQTYNPGQVQTSIGDTGAYYNKAGDAVYNQYLARAQPANDRATDQLRTQLYNSGLKEGDAAYDTQMAQLRQSQQDAMTNASLQATQTAGSEAQRMQGMDVASGNFANSAAQQQLNGKLAAGQEGFNEQLQSGNYQNTVRQQQISEDLQKRGFTLNEINSLLSGQQVQTGPTPTFSQAGVGKGADYSSAAANTYAANLNATNASNAATAQTVGGIASLGMLAYLAAA